MAVTIFTLVVAVLLFGACLLNRGAGAEDHSGHGHGHGHGGHH